MAGAGSFMQGMANGMGLGMQYRRQQEEEQQQKKIDQASAQPDIQQQASTLENMNRVISDQGKVTEYVASEEAKRDQQIKDLREMQERFDSQGQNTGMNNGAGGGQAGGSGAGSFMTSFAGNVDPSKLKGMFGGGGSAAGTGGASAAGGGGGAAGGAGGGGGFGLSSIFGGGSAAGGGAGAAGGSSAAGGAASSGAGGLASAGPWAALAAVILANESNARDNDYRDKDDKKYAQDLLGGAVLEQDLNQRWLPKIYGKDLKNDKLGLGHDQKAIGEFGSGDFSNGFKALEDGTLGKIAKGIKKLF